MVRPTGVGRRLAWESRDKRVQPRQGQELRPAGLGCRHSSNGGRLCRGLGAGPWRVGGTWRSGDQGSLGFLVEVSVHFTLFPSDIIQRWIGAVIATPGLGERNSGSRDSRGILTWPGTLLSSLDILVH